VPRSAPDAKFRDDLVVSIDALAEQTGQIVMERATDAARAHDEGRRDATVELVSALAICAGISAGEVTWLTSELEAVGGDAAQLAAAGAAVLRMSHGTISAAVVGQSLADEAESTEITASAEALRRVAAQLLALAEQLSANR
jgi:hypothetical protein